MTSRLKYLQNGLFQFKEKQLTMKKHTFSTVSILEKVLIPPDPL